MKDSENEHLWNDICEHVRKNVGRSAFERWFSETRLVEVAGGDLVVGVPNAIFQHWIECNYLTTLTRAASVELAKEGRFALGDVVRIRFACQENGGGAGGNGGPPAVNGGGRGVRGRGAGGCGGGGIRETGGVVGGGMENSDGGNGSGGDGASRRRLERRMEGLGINPRNSFDHFVVGTSNQFAHAACLQVAQHPGRHYNPLFIYGGVGLGKTHLMQAIAQHILGHRKGAKVLYVTTEAFTNEFIHAVQEGSLGRFRKRYREPHVLLIDDVQFLGGRERTQEEFFHTFNSLMDGRRQIVLSSDRPPSDIKELEERLVSRFEWGLTAGLQPPDVETRLAILQKKMECFGVEVDKEIVEFIALRVRNNVRRLEGALMRVASLRSLNGSALSIEEVEKLLRDVLDEEESSSVTIDRIQTVVARHFDIRKVDMTNRRRPRGIALARQVAMHLSRLLTKAPYKEIGEAFGGRDHGTVIYACRKIEAAMRTDAALRRTIEQLIAEIREHQR